jgi:hypothetical protein
MSQSRAFAAAASASSAFLRHSSALADMAVQCQIAVEGFRPFALQPDFARAYDLATEGTVSCWRWRAREPIDQTQSAFCVKRRWKSIK